MWKEPVSFINVRNQWWFALFGSAMLSSCPPPKTQANGSEKKKAGYLPTHSWLKRKKKERKAHDAGHIIKNVWCKQVCIDSGGNF